MYIIRGFINRISGKMLISSFIYSYYPLTLFLNKDYFLFLVWVNNNKSFLNS